MLSTKLDSALELELLELAPEPRRASKRFAWRSKRLFEAFDKDPRIEPRMEGDSLLSAALQYLYISKLSYHTGQLFHKKVLRVWRSLYQQHLVIATYFEIRFFFLILKIKLDFGMLNLVK